LENITLHFDSVWISKNAKSELPHYVGKLCFIDAHQAATSDTASIRSNHIK